MEGDKILLYIWLAGIIPALLITIRWFNFKELDGRTVVDVRKIFIIICGGLIGNWGIVAIYLWCVGMWIVVKLGEWGEKICDITFYDSGKVESKEKNNK